MKLKKFPHVVDKPELHSVIFSPEGLGKSIFLSYRDSSSSKYKQVEAVEGIKITNKLIDHSVY